MSAYSFECQKAIRTALVAGGLVGGRIHDGPPQSVEFPWIEIGDGQIIPDDTASWSVPGQSDQGVSEFIDLHVWGRAHAGKKEVKDIIDAIFDRLHDVALTITGRASGLSWVRTVRILLDPDGVTRHAIVTVEVIHRS